MPIVCLPVVRISCALSISIVNLVFSFDDHEFMEKSFYIVIEKIDYMFKKENEIKTKWTLKPAMHTMKSKPASWRLKRKRKQCKQIYRQ